MENINRIRTGFLAPDFTLRDSQSRKIRLSDFWGKKNVLLFFYQGAKCEFCLQWAYELAKACDRIRSKNAEVVAISPDENCMSEKLKKEKGIEFPILKDDKGTEGKSQAPKASEQYGVQMSKAAGSHFCPAVFIVDKGGIIRFRKVCTHSSQKARVDELLCELEKLS